MKKIIFLLGLVVILISCEKYDEEILPIVGAYESVIVGLTGPFIMSVSADYGDNVFIDAPFDGEIWSVVSADIDDKDRDRKKIDIYYQEIEPGISIWGRGVYFGYSIQLDYTMSFYGDEYDYSLVGTKM